MRTASIRHVRGDFLESSVTQYMEETDKAGVDVDVAVEGGQETSMKYGRVQRIIFILIDKCRSKDKNGIIAIKVK